MKARRGFGAQGRAGRERGRPGVGRRAASAFFWWFWVFGSVFGLLVAQSTVRDASPMRVPKSLCGVDAPVSKWSDLFSAANQSVQCQQQQQQLHWIMKSSIRGADPASVAEVARVHSVLGTLSGLFFFSAQGQIRKAVPRVKRRTRLVSVLAGWWHSWFVGSRRARAWSSISMCTRHC